jgi:hypothetical protein
MNMIDPFDIAAPPVGALPESLAGEDDNLRTVNVAVTTRPVAGRIGGDWPCRADALVPPAT